MKKILHIIFIVCICIFVNINCAKAEECSDYSSDPTACENYGCVYTQLLEGGTCARCETNQYRDTTTTPYYTCMPCDSSQKPDGAIYVGPGNDDNDICPWTLTCTANTVWANNTCKTCPNGSTAPQVIVSFDRNGRYSFTVNGETVSSAPTCNTHDDIDCSTQSDLQNLCSEPGSVEGTAKWDDTSGTYDYATCTCKRSVNISNGTKQEKCSFTANGTEIDTDACTQTNISCNSGYCTKDGKTCITPPAGMFGPIEDSKCGTCPAGSTSDPSDNESITNCYYTYDTKFKDLTGTFTLPVINGRNSYVFKN